MALTATFECGDRAPHAKRHGELNGSTSSGRGERTDYDVIIVGGGPAGSAAAIQLAARGFAERVLLLDRAVFPRHKLCGGGVVREADRLLGFLGVRADVPSVPIHTVRFDYAGGHAVRHSPHMFRVVRREEFDHALLRAAAERGVAIRQGVRVTQVVRAGAGIGVAAGTDNYTCRVLIGADGANSVVRKALIGGHQPRFVALEVLTGMPAELSRAPADGQTAVFDFRPASRGLRGYRWDFPSVRAGEPLMNRGLGGAGWTGDGSLRDLFVGELDRHGIGFDADALEGATAPLYDPAVAQSSPHVLLAGDAVGIDPWFGEGISAAIGTGILAAHAAADAFERNDFTFPNHRRRVRDSAIGWMLRRNRAKARNFYRAAPHAGGLAPWLGSGEHSA
jgi:flavin-dependent dehydrogenase